MKYIDHFYGKMTNKLEKSDFYQFQDKERSYLYNYDSGVSFHAEKKEFPMLGILQGKDWYVTGYWNSEKAMNMVLHQYILEIFGQTST